MFLEFLGSYREFQVWKYFTYMNCLSVSKFFLHLGTPSRCRAEGRGVGHGVTGDGGWDTG